MQRLTPTYSYRESKTSSIPIRLKERINWRDLMHKFRMLSEGFLLASIGALATVLVVYAFIIVFE